MMITLWAACYIGTHFVQPGDWFALPFIITSLVVGAVEVIGEFCAVAGLFEGSDV